MKKNLLIFVFQVLLTIHNNTASAQRLQYSNENVFINNPDQLQLVANIAGNNHLLSFNKNENPVIFIFDRGLQLQATTSMPFKFPERSQLQIIRFDDFYYLYIHPQFTPNHFFFKIDAKGNFTDLSPSFQKLLASQSKNIKLGFQLIAYQNSLWMVYHTALDNHKKNTVVVAQADSLLNIVSTQKVAYDFRRDEENLVQEILMFGKYLLVLKTARSGTALEMMKVYLNTGYAITNEFASSGYFYSQPGFTFNAEDSSVTISALLTEPRTNTDPKRFIFISRLDKALAEKVPFAILRSQFKKNTGTNFLVVNGLSAWMRLRAEREQNNRVVYEEPMTLYQDMTSPDANFQNTTDNNRLFSQMTQPRSYYSGVDPQQDVRFTLLDQDLKIISDSLVRNSKDSYTLKAGTYKRFEVNNKQYMLLGQQFVKNSRGLLMINANGKQQLTYTDLRVVDRNDYLLGKSQVITGEGIIIPYIHKLEAGLLKIIME